ncbi:tyrosine-type recombinase/integrase [Streptomyces sp. NBC_01803]|uniref:tyrosine-type recombinase/integrase n=1 Tax=Streptomyces sp. NBC_01803 TaxID=2975946 RepID=UPI002DD7FB5B|nr:site-specific integrase [Streptomyces sp. NBC_01803]WSA45114.1 site-specific integrase [Streptomyces sp. NBC_01803]
MPRRRAFDHVRRLPSGRYQASYLAPDGRRRPAPTTFETKTAANQWLATVQADMLRGVWHPQAGTITLGAYYDKWLATNLRIKKRGTRSLYRRDADRWLLPEFTSSDGTRVHLGAMPLNRVHPPGVRDWYQVMGEGVRAAATERASGPTYRGHPARWWAERSGYDVPRTGRLPRELLAAWETAGSPTPPRREPPADAGRDTVARLYRLLHAVLESARKDGLITVNPCRLAGASDPGQRARAPVEPREVHGMVAAFTDRYRAALWFAVYTALRAGQVWALRRRDVDLENLRVRVAVGLVELPKEGITFDDPKTEGTARWTTITPAMAAILAKHLDEYVPPGPDALVFGTRTGRPVRASQRSKMFHRARLAVGRPDVRWQDLRSATAMFMLDSGASDADVRVQLNHKTDRAARRYRRTSEERRRRLTSGLDDHLAAPVNVLPLRKGA